MDPRPEDDTAPDLRAATLSGVRWTSAARLLAELEPLLLLPADELRRGAGGMAEGVPPAAEGLDLPKFRPGGLLVVHAGGDAGLFSAVVGGWVSGEAGSTPVTTEVRP